MYPTHRCVEMQLLMSNEILERDKGMLLPALSPHIVSDGIHILKWEDTCFHLCCSRDLARDKILSFL